MKFSVMLEQLSSGMLKSMGIFFLTLIFSLPLGLLIAFGRMSKNKILRTVMKVYISVMRGTPLMLQLLVVYFGPFYLFGMKIGGSYRFLCNYHWIRLELCGVFCRNLSFRNRIDAGRDSMRQRGCLATARLSAFCHDHFSAGSENGFCHRSQMR